MTQQDHRPLPIETYQPRTALIDMLKEKAPSLYESVMARRRLEHPEQYLPSTPPRKSLLDRNYTPIPHLVEAMDQEHQAQQDAQAAEAQSMAEMEDQYEYQMQLEDEARQEYEHEEEPLPWEE